VALAVVVGRHSTALPAATRARLVQIGNGQAPGAGRILVNAARVQCRESNVAINDWSCELTFGARTVRLTGMAAHEVLATLGENGVPSDGAAGSIYWGVLNLSCTLTPREIRGGTGGGARCTWTSDQG
jgi:hypothetical protein